jgi:hypothetical protein
LPFVFVFARFACHRQTLFPFTLPSSPTGDKQEGKGMDKEGKV